MLFLIFIVLSVYDNRETSLSYKSPVLIKESISEGVEDSFPLVELDFLDCVRMVAYDNIHALIDSVSGVKLLFEVRVRIILFACVHHHHDNLFGMIFLDSLNSVLHVGRIIAHSGHVAAGLDISIIIASVGNRKNCQRLNDLVFPGLFQVLPYT